MFSFLKNTYPLLPEYSGIGQPWVWLTCRSHTLKENWLSLSQQSSVSNSSSACDGSSSPHPPSTLWFCQNWTCPGLVQCFHNHCKFTLCNFPGVPRKHCFVVVIHPLSLLNCFLCLFHDDPWALVGETGCKCPVQGWALYLSYSLHIDQLWESVLITVYCKKMLLWWGLREALIHEYKCYWSQFNTISI